MRSFLLPSLCLLLLATTGCERLDAWLGGEAADEDAADSTNDTSPNDTSPGEASPSAAGASAPAEASAPLTPLEPLASEAQLAEILPRLKREGETLWARRHGKVPGHYAAHMVRRDNKRPVLMLTIDDLLHQPERRAQLAAWKQELAPGVLGEVVPGVQVRAFVAQRYEIGLYAEADLRQDHDALMMWFENLRLKELIEEKAKP